jgi:hypothetical protein
MTVSPVFCNATSQYCREGVIGGKVHIDDHILSGYRVDDPTKIGGKSGPGNLQALVMIALAMQDNDKTKDASSLNIL